MFVSMLEEEQRRVLLRAAAVLVERDGIVPDKEREILAALNVEAGLDEVPPPPGSDEELLAELQAAFQGIPTASNVLLLELAGVAVIDGDAHSAELDFLRLIADRIGAPETLVSRALEFAERAKAIFDDGRSLIVSEQS